MDIQVFYAQRLAEMQHNSLGKDSPNKFRDPPTWHSCSNRKGEREKKMTNTAQTLTRSGGLCYQNGAMVSRQPAALLYRPNPSQSTLSPRQKTPSHPLTRTNVTTPSPHTKPRTRPTPENAQGHTINETSNKTGTPAPPSTPHTTSMRRFFIPLRRRGA